MFQAVRCSMPTVHRRQTVALLVKLSFCGRARFDTLEYGNYSLTFMNSLLDAAHSRYIPTLLKGKSMPLKLFPQTLSRRSLLRPKGSAHTRVRYDGAIETTRREAS